MNTLLLWSFFLFIFFFWQLKRVFFFPLSIHICTFFFFCCSLPFSVENVRAIAFLRNISGSNNNGEKKREQRKKRKRFFFSCQSRQDNLWKPDQVVDTIETDKSQQSGAQRWMCTLTMASFALLYVALKGLSSGKSRFYFPFFFISALTTVLLSVVPSGLPMALLFLSAAYTLIIWPYALHV